MKQNHLTKHKTNSICFENILNLCPNGVKKMSQYLYYLFFIIMFFIIMLLYIFSKQNFFCPLGDLDNWYSWDLKRKHNWEIDLLYLLLCIPQLTSANSHGQPVDQEFGILHTLEKNILELWKNVKEKLNN